ncbi:50S ribosomal protein L28 [candidate division KSB1 bacterium]|nr:50S ribosomal protein L28 [candidate division KSB1 bacterium]
MAKKCHICGKGPMVGNSISHAHNLNKRRWMPNLKKLRIVEKGSVKRAYVCTRCIRSGKVEKAL